MGGLTSALIAGLMHGPTYGIYLGLATPLALGLQRLGGAWLWFVIARTWLAARGQLPWRLMRFLNDAYQRGVLRQVGATYQFRHARLQDHLVASHRK
jgi:hypothetical protein